MVKSQTETKFLKTEAHIKLFKIKKNLVSNTIIKKEDIMCQLICKMF